MASRGPIALGLCATDITRALSFLNESTERLIQNGEWWGGSQVIRMCVSDGCITTPREVADILYLSVNGYNAPVQPQAYEFIDDWHGYLTEACSGTRDWLRVVDRSAKIGVCTFADVRGTNKRIRAYIDNPNDADKTITIQGYDSNPVWILTDDGDTEGETLTLVAQPAYAETTMDVSSITGVLKDVTKGAVRLYEYDTETESLRALAVYEPTETNPSYRRFFVDALANAGCQACQCTETDPSVKTVVAIVKLEFVPATKATDRLLISNLPALKHECMAVRYGEMDDTASKQLAQAEHLEAIRLLNKELRHYCGRDRTAIKVRTFTGLQRRLVGRLF